MFKFKRIRGGLRSLRKATAWKFRISECRVGIVGLGYSGKTVLLTSLINHLQDHDPCRFRLGRDRKVDLRKFEELPVVGSWGRFDYKRHRDRLVQGHLKWVDKTKDCVQYVCQFERSDWHNHVIKIKLFDLPGERVADAIMAGMDYAKWSDRMLGIMDSDQEYKDYCGVFLQVLDSGTGSPEEDLLRAYRVSLAQLVLHYKPYVSPSTFVLDTAGRMVDDRTPECEGLPRTQLPPERIASTRHAGMAEDSQFAPLPLGWRNARSELAQSFSTRYEEYKTKVVLPWRGAVKSCHSVIVLVDVVTILENGHGMCNDTQQVVQDLLDVLDPGETLLGKAIRGAAGLVLPHGRRPGRLTRVAFVAPKLDLVHPDERPKMIDLVKEIAEKRAKDKDGLKVHYTNCSAAVSTDAVPANGDNLYLSDLVGVEQKQYRTPRLPSRWEHAWQAGKYVFPRVRPFVPPLRMCPPEHVNLDDLLDFAMCGRPAP